MNLTSLVDRKMVDILREKLKDEKDPVTRKIIELKLAKREAQRENKV
ncbi:hypothetical protein M7775_05675 [Sporomusa sphaeroides DSM 2875]|nr:hypothetical protein [Sporomusa sphaeroides]MCM0758065.1 hypothetical protein [Sporomusa sphaeroides DSM 2875]